MDLVLCHITADFDTLGAAVGFSRLHPGARIVLAGGAHPAVRNFLALHRDEYALIERRSVNPGQIRSITVVDTQSRDRLGKVAEWLDLPQVNPITVYDHHMELAGDIPATQMCVEAVGAATTLLVEQLQAQALTLTGAEATVMALGIHVDTGSLTFDHSTARDALALAWLMQQGASLKAIAEYIDPGLSPELQELLRDALNQVHTESRQGHQISKVLLSPDAFVPGLSSVAGRLMELTESDALLLAAQYPTGREGGDRLTLIARSKIEGTNLNELLEPFGGGGHPRAAAATLKTANGQEILDQVWDAFLAQIPQPPTARDLMSSPVRTIRPETTIEQAQRILLRYGHSGLSVVNDQDQLVGVISRRDLDIALHHGFGHAPVKGYMTTNLKTIAPDTLLPEIEDLMVTYDIGRLPVLENDQLVGIITRTDVLRQLHQTKEPQQDWAACPVALNPKAPRPHSLLEVLQNRLVPELWEILMMAARDAQAQGWHLYLIGGAVRDLLLADPAETLMLSDIDLVVDGFHRALQAEAGVELARRLRDRHPESRLQIHGQFQTAALLWHKDPVLDSLWVDIATARTEFYPYPAANPEVEASSIRQDLYRRDFTINALAIRLTNPHAGELLDFFGGLLDLQAKQIRVLHANSFIEDPTRIYRAVRFAVRLGFKLEPQTEGYIRHALSQLASRLAHTWTTGTEPTNRVPALQTRLKNELKYILAAPYWKSALRLLGDLAALQCIHPTLTLNSELWWQLRLCDRWLRQFGVTPDAEAVSLHPQHPPLYHWQMLLEVIIAHLAAKWRAVVAENLQLPADCIARLANLEATEQQLQQSLSNLEKPSQVVRCLNEFDPPTLILVAVHSSQGIRRQIWRYLTDWSHTKPPLDGHDLKTLGYRPGPQFKVMLDTLLSAQLDGQLTAPKTDPETMRNAAIAYLHHHFPPPSPSPPKKRKED